MLYAYRTMRSLALSVLTCCLVAAASAAEDTPSGTISLQSTSVAAGVGVQWGEGILIYNGKKYPFSVHGLESVKRSGRCEPCRDRKTEIYPAFK